MKNLAIAALLWGAAVAQVPFVDVLNTILEEDLPLTQLEWREWGNPVEDPKAFDTIRAWSPYDRIRRQAYPPVLVTSGLNDPRVTYWEAEDLRQVQIVFVGESHDNQAHHCLQLDVIKALHSSGEPLAVGFEMFIAKSQEFLDRWVSGNISEDAFIRAYYENWNFPCYTVIFFTMSGITGSRL